MINLDYDVYQGIEHLDKVASCSSLSFDTETLQLKPEMGKLRLLQLGSAARRCVVLIDLFACDDEDLETLGLFFTNGERFWLAHNAAFDLAWLQTYGWVPRGQVRCSMLASRLLLNGVPKAKHNLLEVARRMLDIALDKEEQRSDWSKDLSDSQLTYAAKDVMVLCEMDGQLHRDIMQAGLGKAYALECKALHALAAMGRTGLPWDKDGLVQVGKDYEKEIANLGREFLLTLDEAMPEEEKLPREEDGSFNTRAKTTGRAAEGTKKFAGFNINSPKQLQHKFTVLLGKPPTDKNGKVSCSRPVLKEYASDHRAIAIYLDWKKAEKRRQMADSLVEKMDERGFIKASFWQLGSDTGRMTCSEPNLLQIPRDESFRGCVVAPEGWVFLDADYSQMELRLAAAVAKDEAMSQAFIDGKDLHTATAEAIGCDRQIAKSANFGLLYGSGAKGLANYAAGMGVALTEDEANVVRSKWLATYSGIQQWHRSLDRQARKTEGQEMPEVRIPLSQMRRYLPGELNKLTIRANTPIQGAGAAILKCTLGNLWKYLKGAEAEAKLCAAIHDELLMLVREDAADKWKEILRDVMESAEARWLGDIPAVADVNVGRTWAEAH